MGGESPKPGVTPTGAVFLSYASEDAEAAEHIATALRAAGVEVWFDQSELRGGDAWDRMIRKQIKACALFIPVISRHTHERREGYFRLEWKLAVDRSNLISATQAFLLPVVIDDTREDDEEIPERIRDIHWTRLAAGETPTAFVDRVQRLLSGEASTPIRGTASAQAGAVGTHAAPVPLAWSPKRGLVIAIVVAGLGAVAYLALETPWISNPTAPATGSATINPSAFAPPAHSVAVLPFTNISSDPKQQYFSDGLTEELINALARIDSLQVIARTSSFSFRGQSIDIGTIAHKLNVAAILEGSVRRERNKVRVTVQLINTATGFHIWSEDYDRDLKDVLSLQSEIATTVAQQLRAKLLDDEVSRIEVGGTRIPAAYDAYLQAEQMFPTADSEAEFRRVVAAFDSAIRLDPDYAAAYAGRAVALIDILVGTNTAVSRDDLREQARSSAERAVALAPDYGYAHGALWFVRALGFLDFQGAAPEVERAVAIDPGNARIQQFYAVFNNWLRHPDRAIQAQRHAVRLDPRSYRIRINMAGILFDARRYEEAQSVLAEAEAIHPDGGDIPNYRASIMNTLGRPDQARALCTTAPTMRERDRHGCLAIALHALGDLEGAEREFAALRGMSGDSKPFEYAEIDAQWARPAEALRWLEIAERLRDTGLQRVRVSWALDPLRNQPAFQAFERGLNWPP